LPIPFAAIPNPAGAIPSLPLQPNSGGIAPSAASILPGAIEPNLPFNTIPQPPQPAGANPFDIANPVASAIGGKLPVSVPGWMAAQAAPNSRKPRPSLPPGVVAPTAPLPGDVPPLLSKAKPLAAEAAPTPADHKHVSTGIQPSSSSTDGTTMAEPVSSIDVVQSDNRTHSQESSADRSSSTNMGEQTTAWASSTFSRSTHTESHETQARATPISGAGIKSQSTHVDASATDRDGEDLIATSSVSVPASTFTQKTASTSMIASEKSNVPTPMSSGEVAKPTATSISEGAPVPTMHQ